MSLQIMLIVTEATSATAMHPPPPGVTQIEDLTPTRHLPGSGGPGGTHQVSAFTSSLPQVFLHLSLYINVLF